MSTEQLQDLLEWAVSDGDEPLQLAIKMCLAGNGDTIAHGYVVCAQRLREAEERLQSIDDAAMEARWL